jgi:hypothetical protein
MEHRSSRQQWQERYEQWLGTGTSRKAYCQEQGLSYPVFLYWCRQLDESRRGDRTIQAVALSFSSASNRDAELYRQVSSQRISTTGITLPVECGDAAVTISGSISMAALVRLVEAATAESIHACP